MSWCLCFCLGKRGTATACNTSGGSQRNNTGNDLGVTGVNDAGNEAGGAEGGYAERIDATRENGSDYKDEPNAHQQMVQLNGECDDEVHQEVNNGVHHKGNDGVYEVVSDAGDEARGGGGE